MPLVVAPDGSEIDFPDDLSLDEIQSVVRKKFPPKPQQRRVGEFLQQPDFSPVRGDTELAANQLLGDLGREPIQSPSFGEAVEKSAFPIPQLEAPQGLPTAEQNTAALGIKPTASKTATAAMLGVPDTQGAMEWVTGLGNQGINLFNFLKSPSGGATIGTAGLGPAAARLIAAGFGEQMAQQIPESAQQLGKATVEGTPFDVKQAGLNLAGNILMAGAPLAETAMPLGNRLASDAITALEKGVANATKEGQVTGNIPVQREGDGQVGTSTQTGTSGSVQPTTEVAPKGQVKIPVYASDTLSVRSGEDKFDLNRATKITKIVNDQGKEVYAIQYQGTSGPEIVYTDEPMVEMHDKYAGESPAYAKEFEKLRSQKETPSIEKVHEGTPEVPKAASGTTPNKRVRLQLADGKIVPALWNGYWEAPGTPFDGAPSVATVVNDRWSHGMLPKGAKILDEVPSFEEWKKNKAAPPTTEQPKVPQPGEKLSPEQLQKFTDAYNARSQAELAASAAHSDVERAGAGATQEMRDKAKRLSDALRAAGQNLDKVRQEIGLGPGQFPTSDGVVPPKAKPAASPAPKPTTPKTPTIPEKLTVDEAVKMLKENSGIDEADARQLLNSKDSRAALKALAGQVGFKPSEQQLNEAARLLDQLKSSVKRNAPAVKALEAAIEEEKGKEKPKNSWTIRTPSGKKTVIEIDPEKHSVVMGRVIDKATGKNLGTIIGQAEASKAAAAPKAKGKGFFGKLFQGRGATPEQIYGPEAVAAGRAAPIMGKAQYFAFNEEDASIYGTVTQHDVKLDNPLHINSDKAWHDLLQKAGTMVLSSRGKEFYTHPERIPAAGEKLQAYLKAQGYDGVVVQFPHDADMNARGESIKAIRETFGHDTVIKFGEPPAEGGTGTTVPSSTPPSTPEGGLGAWTKEQWSLEALKKTPLKKRQEMARFAGLKTPDGKLVTGPKALADYANERFSEMEKPTEPSTTSTPTGKPPETLEEAWNQYDNTGEIGTVSDLVDIVEGLIEDDRVPTDTQALQDAIDDYRDAVREDKEEWGERSGLTEEYGDAFITELNRTLNKLKSKKPSGSQLPAPTLFIKEGNKLYQVTAEQASKIFSDMARQLRQQGVGPRDTGSMKLYDANGNQVGYVSPNGNVWRGKESASAGKDDLLHNATGLQWIVGESGEGRWDIPTTELDKQISKVQDALDALRKKYGKGDMYIGNDYKLMKYPDFAKLIEERDRLLQEKFGSGGKPIDVTSERIKDFKPWAMTDAELEALAKEGSIYTRPMPDDPAVRQSIEAEAAKPSAPDRGLNLGRLYGYSDADIAAWYLNVRNAPKWNKAVRDIERKLVSNQNESQAKVKTFGGYHMEWDDQGVGHLFKGLNEITSNIDTHKLATAVLLDSAELRKKYDISDFMAQLRAKMETAPEATPGQVSQPSAGPPAAKTEGSETLTGTPSGQQEGGPASPSSTETTGKPGETPMGSQSPGAKVKITPEKPQQGEFDFGKSFFGPAAESGNPLGMLDPTTLPAYQLWQQLTAPITSLGKNLRRFWSAFAMEAVPRLTEANREMGELGARLAVAKAVARQKGIFFAQKVLEGIKEPLFNQKLGTALSEDNLRSIKQNFLRRAEEVDMNQPGAEATVSKLLDQARAVQSLIGQEGSPFQTEEAYQQFLASPNARLAIERHKQLWQEQKDPLFQKANDLDPDVELETRGLQTGARINLKALMPDESSPTAVGRGARRNWIRQAATVLTRDPFAKQAKGTGLAYEGGYTELMQNGFEREYPVAAQHEFIRQILASGNGRITTTEFPRDLRINGEKTVGRIMRLRTWRGNYLQIPQSLLSEYDAVTGLQPGFTIPVVTPVANFLTKQAVAGIAEGTNHAANLLMEMFTGVGPTGSPLANVVIKSIGLGPFIRLPRILIRAMQSSDYAKLLGLGDRREDMLHLMEMGAAKSPYKGSTPLTWLINGIDRGSRLLAADIYKALAQNGYVPDTETGLRNFVNTGAGNYVKALQPYVIRSLRDSGIQPFATAAQTFLTQGLRNMVMAPGAQTTSGLARLALTADKAAGAIGAAVTLAAVQMLITGKPTPPKGTPLGSLGWIGPDGKLHTFNAIRLMGWERGPRSTGLQSYIESKRAGLSENTAIKRAAQSAGATALNYVTGPVVRTATIGITGKRPGMPMIQEAPVVPPGKNADNWLNSQVAVNIKTAMRDANPLIDAIVQAYQGKSAKEIAQRQLNKFIEHPGPSQRTIEQLPHIVTLAEAREYAEYLLSQGRKFPPGQRQKWLNERFKTDGVSDEVRGRIIIDLRKRGFFLP